MDNDRLTLTVEEAARLLGISRRSATSWWPEARCRASGSADASWCPVGPLDTMLDTGTTEASA